MSASGQIPVLAPDLAHADLGFDEAVARRLAALEAQSFWFIARNQVIDWLVRSRAPGAASLLEVGCGTGFVLAHLERAFPALELTGGDASLAMLGMAEERLTRTRLVQLDAERLPFDAEFDVVSAFDTLEHLESDELVLRQMRQAVRPGGALIVAVPQHRWLWSVADDVSHHQRRYTRRELREKVEAAGFAVEWMSSFVSTLLPVMALARVRRKDPASYDWEGELVPGRFLNRALLRVLRLEAAGLRAGLRYPAGGSLFLVARRRD